MKKKFYAYFFAGAVGLIVSQGVYAQANTALSNLSATSVNQDLVPSASNVRSLGSLTKGWRKLYLDSSLYLAGNKFVHYGTSGSTQGVTAIGFSVLLANSGFANTGIGYYALAANTSGNSNAAIGTRSLQSNTTGKGNMGVGYFSLYSNKTGNANVAIGVRALNSSVAGSYQVAIGDSALYAATTGSGNTAIGSKTLFATTNGSSNTANGYRSLYTNTGGSSNSASGYSTLYSNTTGYGNTAAGYYSLYSNTTGGYNSAYGIYSLYQNTTGYYNTAAGLYSLYSNTTGSYSTAYGSYSLYANTTGTNNSAYGYAALYLNTTGSRNTANGYLSLYLNSTGSDNTSYGYNALYNNTTGSFNTAHGSEALEANTTGNYQTATGYQALLVSTTSFSNTATGYRSLYSTTTGSYSTGTGLYSLYSNTTGSYNTGIGLSALYNNTTGSFNTALGNYADVNSGALSNATAIGYNAKATASNQVMLGNTSVTAVWAAGSYLIYSDGRFKKNIKDNVPGLEFIKLLKPVTYNYDIKGLNAKIAPASAKNDASDNAARQAAPEQEKAINDKEKKQYTGLIAQEVEAAAKKLNYDFSGVYKPQSDKDVYGLSYSEFVVPLVKAVQELSDKNDAKDEKIATLEARLEKLEALLKTSSSVTSLNGASLGQNSPNPFNGNTVISYNVPQRFSSAALVIYDAAGRALKQVNIAAQGKGTLKLDAATLVSGAYNYSLLVDGKIVDTKKMVLAK